MKFKPNINTSQFLRIEPITFKEHTITVKKQRQNIIRVTFKNVPLNVPDEEILTLCAAYGKAVDSCVQYERLNNIKGRGLTGSTRYVDMELESGQTFENFYWMEGPLQGDVGKRIVVLHTGQATQCSHCLRRAGAGCPAMGIGKACHRMGTPREKMNTYMQSLRDKIGYVSMKIRYAENQAKMFPSLIGLPGEKSSEQELQSLWNMEEGENTVEGGFTTILTPVEEKDKIISEQTSKIQSLIDQQVVLPSLQENLRKIEAENNLLKRKLSFTRRATEQKILDNISNEEFYKEDPHLVCVLSATLEEEFELLQEDDLGGVKTEPSDYQLVHRSRKDQFLSSIEDKVNKENTLQVDRLSHIKTQVLDRIRSTKIKRLMARSDSASSSVSKRRLSFCEDDFRSTSRPRTASPLLPQDGDGQ